MEPSDPPMRPKRRARSIALALLLATTLGVTATAGWAYWALGGTSEGATVRVIIPEGANASQIAAELKEAGVVRSGFMFRLVSRMRGLAAGLKPGAYDMRVGLGVSGALDKLKTGIPLKVFRLTVPEGKTILEIARLVGEKTPVSASAFLRAAADAAQARTLHPVAIPQRVGSLEGLLYPDTYDFDEKATAADIVTRLLGEFRTVLEPLNISKRAAALKVTPYQALVIASLIEREAEGDGDRDKISSVIYNRLRIGMRLQIDATVQYAIEKDTGNRKGEKLTSDDNRNYESPYNTYRIAGLPPTPIASAGRASLVAALNPADTDFLYYRVSRSTGKHCFGRTLAEHNRCAA